MTQWVCIQNSLHMFQLTNWQCDSPPIQHQCQARTITTPDNHDGNSPANGNIDNNGEGATGDNGDNDGDSATGEDDGGSGRGCTQDFPATKSKKLVKVPRAQQSKRQKVSTNHSLTLHPNCQFQISTRQAEIDPQVNITRHSCRSLPALVA